LRYADEDEIRYEGARRVKNLTQKSTEDFSEWTNVRGTITPNIADPNGGTTATTFRHDSGASAYLHDGGQTLETGAEVRNSIWIRRRTGTGSVRMYTGGDTFNIFLLDSIITTEWQR